MLRFVRGFSGAAQTNGRIKQIGVNIGKLLQIFKFLLVTFDYYFMNVYCFTCYSLADKPRYG